MNETTGFIVSIAGMAVYIGLHVVTVFRWGRQPRIKKWFMLAAVVAGACTAATFAIREKWLLCGFWIALSLLPAATGLIAVNTERLLQRQTATRWPR